MLKPESNKMLVPDKYKHVVNVGATRSGKTADFKLRLLAKGYTPAQVEEIFAEMKRGKQASLKKRDS